MSDFAFNGAGSFDEDFEALLDFLRERDGDLAEIVRANASGLAAIVQDGDRSTNARAAFNAAIAKALDALATPEARAKEGG